jgi:hypothetical protein
VSVVAVTAERTAATTVATDPHPAPTTGGSRREVVSRPQEAERVTPECAGKIEPDIGVAIAVAHDLRSLPVARLAVGPRDGPAREPRSPPRYGRRAHARGCSSAACWELLRTWAIRCLAWR